MTRYALLPSPSANRVYSAAALDLALAELAFVEHHALGGRLAGIGVEELGGVRYLSFSTAGGDALSPEDLVAVGSLSSCYAVFERDGDTLRPLRGGGALHHWDDDLISIPRYPGRTNDQWTALLVNVAVVAGHGAAALARGGGAGGRRLRVLDPVCGRGTTTNQAVMCGYDGAGVDIDGRDIEAWATFFTTWLQDKRIKHSVERHRLRRSRATGGGVRIDVALWAGKAAKKAGGGQRAVMVADDTTTVVEHLGARSVDAIAGDLPYGVAHGSRGGDRGDKLARRPDELLAAALPAWREVLRPGGAMALAWNVRTMSHEAMAAAVTAAGLEVVAVPEGRSFLHRVDRTITRDLVVARRPGAPRPPA